MIQQSHDRSTKFRIVEVGEEGWAEFKKLEADQRATYAKSEEAKRDHEAWVNAPMARDEDWGSIPTPGYQEPVRRPAHPLIPHSQRMDWAGESIGA